MTGRTLAYNPRMPVRKTARRAPKKAAVAAPQAPSAASRRGTASMRLPAALAGAARRRKAKRVEAEAAKPSKAKASSRVNWSKVARAARHPSKDDVRQVLDKGMSKADQLLESAMKWVVKLAIRAKALYDMLEAWWHGKFDFPTGTLQAVMVALLYFLSPLDIIPDVLPLFGLADDAAVFAFVVRHVKSDLEAYAAATGKTLSDLGL